MSTRLAPASSIRSRARAWVLVATAAVLSSTFSFAPPARAADGAQDFSPAERALFMSNQFATLKPPATLRYTLRKSGSQEPGFTDQASLQLKAQADGACCSAVGEFLGGERRIELPPVEQAKGNPITLYFLERDIREMQRLTKGQPNYFRKRIRMAVYQGATLRDVSVSYRGKPVAAQEISITPYVDDPNHQRFEQYTGKRYVFTLSNAVPGGVYAIRTRVDGATKNAPPLLTEDLLIEGADEAPAAKP